MQYVIFGFLCLIGVYDMYLIYKGRPTISRRIWDMFPKWLDFIFLILFTAIVWWLGGGISWILIIWILGNINGHFFWQK